MINQSTIDEIKNRMDIVEVVDDFVSLKKSGSSYKALSPFTAEKTPSFFVVPSKGIFKCFSSGKGGDAITFVMEVDGLSYVEALKYLANKYGIEIQEEEKSDEAQLAQNKRESLYIVINYASEYFSELLHNHEEGKSIGLSYFHERGFSEETIKTFKLGYSLNIWDGLYHEAKKAGYDEKIIEEAGLIIKKDEKVYDRFRGRVIFPIQNITGKVIAFGARILTSNTPTDNKTKQPKYINSPETELYNKSKVLYGLYQSKQEIRLQENCFLVEGYTDVISMHQVGIKNVVSSSGTALTEDQVKLIRRYTENVTILYDGDPAGIRASFRGIDILLEGGLNVKAVSLPVGEDPDSQSKKLGATAFQHYIDTEAVDFIRFKVSSLLDEVGNDPIKKAGLIKDIVGSISKIDDSIKRAIYIKECSIILSISESVLIVEQNKLLQEKNKEKRKRLLDSPAQDQEIFMPIEDEQVSTIDQSKKIVHQEKESIRLLINYGQELINKIDEKKLKVLDYILNEADEIEFTHPVYNKIISLIKEKNIKGEIADVNYLMTAGNEDVQKVVIELSASKYEISEFWNSKFHIHVPHEKDFLKEAAYTNMLRLKFNIIQLLMEVENEKLKTVEGEMMDDVLDEINELKKTEVEIAKILGNVTVK